MHYNCEYNYCLLTYYFACNFKILKMFLNKITSNFKLRIVNGEC